MLRDVLALTHDFPWLARTLVLNSCLSPQRSEQQSYRYAMRGLAEPSRFASEPLIHCRQRRAFWLPICPPGVMCKRDARAVVTERRGPAA